MKFFSLSLSDAFLIFNKGFLNLKSALVPKIANFTVIQDYRVWAKKSISRYSADNTNFEMLVNLSLFTFAFSQMIWFRYQENSFSYFLKNTFPGVCLPSQTLSWDTFSTLFFENEYLKLKKVDMYPDTLILETDSNKFFNQKLLDIGVLSINKEKQAPTAYSSFILKSPSTEQDKNNTLLFSTSEEEHTHTIFDPIKAKETIGSIGSTRSSFFSYRLPSNLNLFADQFPSKLESNFDLNGTPTMGPLFSSSSSAERDLDLTDFLQSQEKYEENILFFKVKRSLLSSQRNDKVSRAKQLSQLTKTIKFPKNFEIPQKLLLAKEAKNRSYSKKNDQNILFLKAFFTKKPNITEVSNLVLTNTNDLSTRQVSSASQISSKAQFKQPKKQSRTSKKVQFFSKEVTNFSNYAGLNPFSSFENLLQAENEKQWGQKSDAFLAVRENNVSLRPLSSSASLNEVNTAKSDQYFFDVCSQEILNSLEQLSSPKPLLWLESRSQSGFLYPDNENVDFLLDQLMYQKNSVISFYKKNLKGTTLPFRQTFFKKNIFQPKILPIQVTFHTNISRSHNQKMAENKKKQFFGFKYRPVSLFFENQTYYEGDGLLKNKLTSDVDLSNKTEVNKWAKKYFSRSNFLTDRKDGFFGYSNKKGRFTNTVSNTANNLLKKEIDSRHLSSFPTTIENLNNKEKQIQEILVPVEAFKDIASSRDKLPQSPRDPELTITKRIFLDYYVQFFKRLPVILCNENWQIPYIKNDEWERIAQKVVFDSIGSDQTKTLAELGKQDNLSQSNLDDSFSDLDIPHRIELSIPLIRIAVPTSTNLINQPWPLTFIDYKPDALPTRFQQLINCKNFTYHSLPWSRSQWIPDLVSQRHFGNLYKRETTIFPNPGGSDSGASSVSKSSIPFFLTACFNDHWEPFTLNSWMILNQFCFVLFSLKVCQSCYQEYGKEVLVFLIEALESLGVVDEGLKDDFQLEKSGTGFRILKTLHKRFKDVAGIDGILPDLSEIVWFLRNSGRSFKMGKVIPKGVLFIGPPGTGKTFLASAIAGEAEVPILVQSGSTLSVPEQPGKGAERLKNLFSQARQLAPCIIFIDEIDTLGEKRQHVTGNPMGHDGMFEALGTKAISTSTYETTTEFSQNPNQFVPESTLFNSPNGIVHESIGTEPNAESKRSSPIAEKQGDQLNILTQFLVEMDGLESRQGIIVIGATNRPGVLDPAFTRPGRFDQVIKLEFPAKQKRIEILKLYSKNLGIDSRISWNYLGSRTDGCSAADLSAAMNESSIQAILKDTTHTVETIEQGLDFIQSSTRQKPYLRKKNGLATRGSQDPFFLKRLAYSQSGKAVLFTLLPQHPPCIFLNLWTPLESTKSENKLRKSDLVSKPFSTRFQLENILIGFYAAKACELLLLLKNSHRNFNIKFALSLNKQLQKKNENQSIKNELDLCPSPNTTRILASNSPPIFTLWESDLNREDMRQGTLLAQSMISKWYFYSKKLSLQKWNSIITNQNEEDTSFFKKLTVLTEMDPILERSEKNWQKVSLRAWWQNNVTQQTGSLNIFSGDWYRIYLADPEQNLRNEEFVPSDEFYHNGERSLNLFQHSGKVKKTSLYWNDLYKNHRDSLYQALVLSSFNKAFSLLDKNREIIDSFADYLLRYETIRENEISSFFLQFKT
uniref:Cell division protein n=1 Tax=Microthamnion kuetzingianum TaxID=34148 RepID=A0A097KNC5_9CHLO|nr:cell division protein [Microthamnion kuetzingianum]AIT94677.1 cell division protein [Microthamnion kuetzingianum]